MLKCLHINNNPHRLCEKEFDSQISRNIHSGRPLHEKVLSACATDDLRKTNGQKRASMAVRWTEKCRMQVAWRAFTA